MSRPALAVVLLIAGRAYADPAGADRATAEAEAQAKSGHFDLAAAKFRDAYAQDPRPELLCDVGVAYHKAKELPRAHLFLSRCLEHGASLDARYMDQVRATVASTEAALRAGPYTPVDITVEPVGATIAFADFAADETVVGAHLVWVPSKQHDVTVTAEGYTRQTVSVDAQGHDVVKLAVRLLRTPPPPPPPPLVVAPRPVPTAPPAPSKLPAITVTVVAVAAAVVGGVAFAKGRARADQAAFALTPDTYQADLDSVGRWNDLMAIGGAVAVVGAGVAAYLWHRAVATQPRIGVEASAAGGSIFVRGAF